MTVHDADLDELTRVALRAAAGDRDALSRLCSETVDPMYRMALRFCGNPTDAEDAAQEVMVRPITGPSTFEGRSRFTTWAYTVAVRQLQRTRRRPTEQSVAGPEPFSEFIDRYVDGVPFQGETTTEGDELAAEITGISPAAHRQRLARARKVMRALMAERCGLVKAENPCRCSKLVKPSIEVGLLDRADPVFARHRGVVLPVETDTLDRAARELDMATAAAQVYRSTPEFRHPASLWESLVEAMPELLGASAT